MKYDVAIIGAGTAGLSAAWTAAEMGAKVIVLERNSHIGLPIRCGELVRLDLLKDLVGNTDSLVRRAFNSYYINTDIEEKNAYIIENSSYFAGCIDKHLLIQFLLNKALYYGAKVQNQMTVRHIQRNNSQMIIYAGHEKLESFQVDDLIICDGVASRAARILGIKTTLPQKGLASCVSAVIHEISSISKFNACKLYFSEKIAPGGYLWIFPTSDSTANIGIGINPLLSKGKTSYEYLKDYITHNFPQAKINNIAFGGIPVYRPLRNFTYENVLVAGDAARQVNPMTGAGITTSIQAGQLAAKACIRTRHLLERRELYDQVWKMKYEGMYMKSYDSRLKLNKKTDQQILQKMIFLKGNRGTNFAVSHVLDQLATN